MAPRALLSLLFGFREPVTPRRYLIAGLLLFGLKYAGDLGLSAAFAAHALPPLSYFNPVLDQRLRALGEYPSWLPAALLVWALPFIWIGVSMSARRAVSARLSAWLGLLFLVPVLNYLLIIALCAAPAATPAPQAAGLDPNEPWRHARVAESALARLQVAVSSALVAAAFGALAAAFSVFGAQQYGSALFIGAPFVLGVISGVLFNRGSRQTVGATLFVGALSVTLAGGALLLLALEGVLCLAMAAVLAYPLAALGALFGRALAGSHREPRAPSAPTLSMLVAWPLLALLPQDGAEPFPARSVLSSIEIDAPPEQVWPNVIGFSPLPPPEEWLLRAGVACPLRARIEGEGVGAIRYCEFTTGAFVEPITAWQPPYRLAFDVAAQPPSMREWSPYELVHAPHLHGGMQSQRGEFTLTRLPGGRTRLTGSTWYRLKMAPQSYWSLYADHVVHLIHGRVLSHIRRTSELAVSQ